MKLKESNTKQRSLASAKKQKLAAPPKLNRVVHKNTHDKSQGVVSWAVALE